MLKWLRNHLKMISFEEALCGHYTNKAQATSDPQKWPWVNIEWTEIKKGKILECKSWYEYEGPNKPYKHFSLISTMNIV